MLLVLIGYQLFGQQASVFVRLLWLSAFGLRIASWEIEPRLELPDKPGRFRHDIPGVKTEVIPSLLGYATDWDVTPIYCSLLVSFTNLEPHTILVESYIAEHQRKDGSWEVVSLPFGTSHGKVFWGVDRKDVREAKYTTLDDAFEGKNIAPSETVRGWLFLTKRFTGVLRLKIATSIGESYTEPLTGMATGGWASQPMLFEKVGPPHLDISNLPITE